MSARGKRDDVHRRLEERYRRLADARKRRLPVAIATRFTEIDGATLGALVSIQLFTTVIPLIIIGFDYFSGFAENASPGTLFIREVGLEYPLTERVRAAFAAMATVVAPFCADADLVTETFWAALHGLAALEGSARIRPRARAERVALVVAAIAGS